MSFATGLNFDVKPHPVLIAALFSASSTVIDETLAPYGVFSPGSNAILQGLDFYISGTISNTFLCWATVNEALFFADEQTFAAGRGGSGWRGAIPFTQFDTLGVHIETTAAVQLGIVAWGQIFSPLYPGGI